TSNICTAQVLLAVIASMYAVYHGPEGLVRIARRVRGWTGVLRQLLVGLGYELGDEPFFDTLRVGRGPLAQDEIFSRAELAGINLRRYEQGDVGVSLGEPVGVDDIAELYGVFGGQPDGVDIVSAAAEMVVDDAAMRREEPLLTHPVFHRYRSETEMMRYLERLSSRDLTLATSMIPLGSCTMKLNAAAEMFPITWPEFAAVHPFAPVQQADGYRVLFERLCGWLGEITGLPAVSLMPNAGAQGEYSGLLVIRAYHEARGQQQRDVCLIPESAHGTNPASAVMAGLSVAVVRCDAEGNIDHADLASKLERYRERLAALMVTYPSTHGVFEQGIEEICRSVHEAGGQVYLDGANMNAMVGLVRPSELGVDVCHLNLHKTFCIPHGGGGPGMGPICAAEHLAPYLPRHPLADVGGRDGIGPVSGAPFGSPNILPISYAYIAMMGAEGLQRASETAILAANYVARRLEPHYPVLYKGKHGLVAHECIVDLRPLRASAGIEVEDVAKRLMDYGFHAPTMSWPVAGTLMIEPTESEGKTELDRFCDAMIAIREEIREIERGLMPRDDNPLKNAPHTAARVTSSEWNHPYSREKAAFPAPWLGQQKYWPSVSRLDNAYGDRHLVCACPPLEAYCDAP
ncbi:MAG: aminomethyl-transferring glycine dehydrogenase, partial [Acidobacteriota bacterium]